MHKLMLVDNDPERSSSLESALQAAGYQHIIRVDQDENLLAAVRKHQPDIILIDMQSPDRDTLESLRNVSKETPKPIVFFAEQSDLETTRAAISAGVSAYIVDDLPGKRLKSVLEVAIARFQEHQKLREELEDYKGRLQDRKDVDKAKGILMQHRNLSEEEAYQLLRKMAMDRNMKIGEAARNFVAAMSLLGGKF
ncbi:MAG: ANTAR domain-containing protein [Gammaproteobacteria bacterium]|nr:ANTAR domain-containing protein [Gammaproteobacteria bacterium]MBU1724725.1 ANTAR domain-containing protein [Gammaproteobacteria bacterium]MBU2005896.1 ANTAR domain-containing protein [Gammaproteobacteria bacterium]